MEFILQLLYKFEEKSVKNVKRLKACFIVNLGLQNIIFNPLQSFILLFTVKETHVKSQILFPSFCNLFLLFRDFF